VTGVQTCALPIFGLTPPDIDVWDYGRRDGRVYVTDEPAEAA